PRHDRHANGAADTGSGTPALSRAAGPRPYGNAGRDRRGRRFPGERPLVFHHRCRARRGWRLHRAMRLTRRNDDRGGVLHYDAAPSRHRRHGAFGWGATTMMAKVQGDMADFTQIYIRRALEPRLQGHGKIDVRKSGPWGITIVHRYTREWNGREVALPVAQLRSKGQKLQLYWKGANGRWVPYENGEEAPFVGSLDACLKEIDHDRWSCFWG